MDKYDKAILAAETTSGELPQDVKDALKVVVREHSPRGKRARKACGLPE